MSIRKTTKRAVHVGMSALALACGDGEQEQTSLPGPERPELEEPSGKVCSAASCFSDFPIELEQPDGWAVGSYEIFVATPGNDPESCVIELGGPAVGGAQGFCAAQSFTVTYVTGGQLHGTSNRVVGSPRDFALVAAGPAIASIHVEQGDAVDIMLTGPDGYFQQGLFAPAWGDYFYPNGPECGPSCRSAPPQTLTVQGPAANE